MASDHEHEILPHPEQIRRETALFEVVVVFFVFFTLTAIGSASMAASLNLPLLLLHGPNATVTNHHKSSLGIKIRADPDREAEPRRIGIDGKANVWLRGSRSAMFPKKPYRLELVDESGKQVKAPLLGMP